MTREELLKRAKGAASPEELIKLAKEADIDNLTEEDAKNYFDALHRSGELSDEELEASAGGCKKGGKTVVTHLNNCDHFICRYCGRYFVTTDSGGISHHGHFYEPVDCEKGLYCCNCQFFIYEGGLWLCNNPAHNAE